MSEYIVCVDDLEESYYRYINIKPETVFGHRLREKIIRCKDCKHYEYWEFRDGRIAHDCARGGDYLFDTEPNGFCKWGERTEGK